MGDTQMTARWYEQVRREKRAKDKWNQKYLTEEQLELERQAEAAALSELRGRCPGYFARDTATVHRGRLA